MFNASNVQSLQHRFSFLSGQSIGQYGSSESSASVAFSLGSVQCLQRLVSAQCSVSVEFSLSIVFSVCSVQSQHSVQCLQPLVSAQCSVTVAFSLSIVFNDCSVKSQHSVQCLQCSGCVLFGGSFSVCTRMSSVFRAWAVHQESGMFRVHTLNIFCPCTASS